MVAYSLGIISGVTSVAIILLLSIKTKTYEGKMSYKPPVQTVSAPEPLEKNDVYVIDDRLINTDDDGGERVLHKSRPSRTHSK